MKVIERVEGNYEAREVKFGKLHGRLPEMITFECECGRMITLDSFVADEGKRGADDTSAVREDYSWLDDCREWLEGKEARHGYYARLEEPAVSR